MVTWLLTTIVWATAASAAAAEAPRPQISGLTSPRQGASWVHLRWESDFTRHEVRYAELYRARGRRGKWQAIPDVATLAYTVGDLKPDTPYEFRVRAYNAAGAACAESAPAVVRTLPERPRRWLGLTFWPERKLPTFPKEQTWPAVAVHEGAIYVLEAVGKSLWLSRLRIETDTGRPAPRAVRDKIIAAIPDRKRLQLEWTQDVTPQTDDALLSCMAPSLCAYGGKLWFTWHVQIPGADGQPPRMRQRLAYYDPSAEGQEGTEPERVSAPLEIVPSAPDRDTCWGSVAEFEGALWVQWTETWQDAAGSRRAAILLGPYDMQRGRIADPVPWLSCPAMNPQATSITPFAGDLLVLFTDGRAREESAEAEPLLCARFDGREFHGTQTLRSLGRNLYARGVQFHDHCYILYQTDVAYPAGGGSYQDISLVRLAARGALAETVEWVADLKHNTAPGLAALEASLVAVHAKWDTPRTGEARFFGTYIGAIEVAGEEP